MTDSESTTRKRPLKIGIMLPESDREMAGATAHWPDFLAMGQSVEELGFDSLWFADHLLMQVPGYEIQGAWEAMSILSALAATTKRIDLAPFVSRNGLPQSGDDRQDRRNDRRYQRWPLILGIGLRVGLSWNITPMAFPSIIAPGASRRRSRSSPV